MQKTRTEATAQKLRQGLRPRLLYLISANVRDAQCKFDTNAARIILTCRAGTRFGSTDYEDLLRVTKGYHIAGTSRYCSESQ